MSSSLISCPFFDTVLSGSILNILGSNCTSSYYSSVYCFGCDKVLIIGGGTSSLFYLIFSSSFVVLSARILA